MQPYSKPPTSYTEQLSLLKSRGVIVKDVASAEQYLSIVGYYRLSAYCIPFEKSRHVFRPNTTFEQIQSLYEFDRNLRFLLDEALEIIEIALRTAVAYYLSHTYGSFAHEDKSIFYNQGNFDHTKWLSKIHEEIVRSKETFIDHYKNKYEGFPKIPIWMAVEVMSLGTLSQLVHNLLREDQIVLAKRFGLHSTLFISWLHTFSYVRNMCAHHSRLWNRELAIAMVMPKSIDQKEVNTRRVGSVIMAINRMLFCIPVDRRVHEVWRKEILQLFTTKIDGFNFMAAMGLAKNPDKYALWQI